MVGFRGDRGERGGGTRADTFIYRGQFFLWGTSLLTDTFNSLKSWGKTSISSAELQHIVSKTVKYILPTLP